MILVDEGMSDMLPFNNGGKMLVLQISEIEELKGNYPNHRICPVERTVDHPKYSFGIFKSTGRKIKYYVYEETKIIELYEDLTNHVV